MALLIAVASLVVVTRTGGDTAPFEIASLQAVPALADPGQAGSSAPSSLEPKDTDGESLAGDTGPQQDDPNAANEPDLWHLSDARVIEDGVSVEIADGTYVSGHIVECTASTETRDIVRSALFRVELSAFRPNHDMVGQRQGVWYTRGSWELRDPDASSACRAAILSGTLSAQSDDNPFGGTDLLAEIDIPTSIGTDGYVRGEGEFTGSGEFEGDLTLRLVRE